MMKAVSRTTLREALRPILASLGNRYTDIDRSNSAGNTAADDAVFEVYIYSVVVKVLQRMGASPKAVPTSKVFRVRRVHGELADTPTHYSYVDFAFRGVSYELHLDTYYGVKMGAGKFEVDVSITDKATADSVRLGMPNRPDHSRLFLLLEAKHYGSTASTSPAAYYLGRCYQLHTTPRPEGLVLSGDMTDDSAKLVTGADLHVYKNLTPLKIHQANVGKLMDEIEAGLRKVL